MSSDRERTKKETEREALLLFLDAYVQVTGQPLDIIEDGENPDFICIRPSGSEVGVELVQITIGPIQMHWEGVFNGTTELEPFVAQELIYTNITRKEDARAKRYVHRVKTCILILQLIDTSLYAIQHTLDGLQDDFMDHGFTEIWISDYSSLDAYGNVELYGLYPRKYWGLHERPNHDSKPYG